MIRWQRTAQPARGKNREAIQWAKEITEYLNAKYPQTPGQVYMERFGTTGTIYWIFDSPDLATLDEVQTQMRADEGYWTFISKVNGAGLFIFPEGREQFAAC